MIRLNKTMGLGEEHIIALFQAGLAGSQSFSEKYNEKVELHLNNILDKFLDYVDLSKEYVMYVVLTNGDEISDVLEEYDVNIQFVERPTLVRYVMKPSFENNVFLYSTNRMCGRYMVEHNYDKTFLLVTIRDERRILIIDKDEIK